MKQRIQKRSMQKQHNSQTIFWAGLVSGTLDGIAASIVFNLKLGLNPGQVMQYIASAVYGLAAFKGSVYTIIVGIVLHFIIAFVASAVFLYAYPKIGILRRNVVTAGLVFGLGIWLFMNLLVVPVTKIQPAPFDAMAALVSGIWHMVLVGLPIALIVKRGYNRSPVI
jgi:uncharacterized membrane protein YagU involved in acid resistance